MPQILETSTVEDEFNLDDLDLSSLKVVSMHDSTGLPEGGASLMYSSCSCCFRA
ncbi:thiazolylpeptide-type bacteriocin [Streptomyces sp. NPDC001617]